jgi:tetratricopeptide (TPR) repeat protein
MPVRLAALAVVALLAACAHTPPPTGLAPAQTMADRVNEQLRLAEAASERGDRNAAAGHYRSALTLQANIPRALLGLGRTAPAGSAEALDALRRYTEVQPRDAKGHMALGDALAKAGSVDPALAQYARARSLSPNDPDVLLGEVRILRDAGRIDALIRRLEDETLRRPYDSTAWVELGRARQRAGQHTEAAQAYARAHEIAPSSRALALMDDALGRAAPSVRPYAGGSEDSDKNRTRRAGADLLVPVGRTRVGLSAERAQVSDPAAKGIADRIVFPVQWLPSHAWRIETAAGIVRLRPDGERPHDRWIGHAAVRWREALDTAAAEARLTRHPLLASPALIARPVMVDQVRGILELPVTSRLVGRIQGEGARLDEPDRTNSRAAARASLGYRAAPGFELQASAGTLGYRRPTSAGYSAPERTVSAELGAAIEVGRFWPFFLSIDTGLGAQRVTEFGSAAGPWKGTFRWFSSLGVELWPGATLALDIEHDNTLEHRAVDAPTDQWRSTSALLSLRIGVGRAERPVLISPESSGALRRLQ